MKRHNSFKGGKMKKTFIFLLFAVGIFMWTAACCQAEPSTGAVESVKNFFLDGKMDYLLAMTAGYDNNVWLDPRRNGDAFTQLYFRPRFTSEINDSTDGILTYELLNVTNWEESNADFIRNVLSAGIDHTLMRKIDFAATYRLGYTDYINTAPDDYLDNSIELKLTQQLAYKMYQSILYDFNYKGYSAERKLRTSVGLNSSKERADRRHTAEYEVGKYFPYDLLRLKFQYYNNDSNDQFFKYYDYDSFQPSISLTHLLSKKFFVNTSFGRQLRYYRTRTLSGDARFKERERTNVGSCGVFYTPKKDLTVGVNWTYRQNHSNEPLDNYAGSLITLNTYYTF
jgi:hypothetical protein